tara:strand:- start:90 stop:524 length:435 start_codon:yes stop_codon:yes gene_type:complete
MANESTSSTLSELYTEIVAEAEFVIQEQSLMRGLVKNYTIAGGGKSVEVPIYSAIAAAAVNEATDLSNTAVNPSSVTVTASEVGVEICHCPNYKKFGEFLGNLIEAIRSQALNVIRKGLGLVKVQRLGIEETIIYPRVPNYVFA